MLQLRKLCRGCLVFVQRVVEATNTEAQNQVGTIVYERVVMCKPSKSGTNDKKKTSWAAKHKY